MDKHTANLVNLPGCRACTKHCKYNAPISDPNTDLGVWEGVAYGCNSIYHQPTPEDKGGILTNDGRNQEGRTGGGDQEESGRGRRRGPKKDTRIGAHITA
jgi:hypothetical protein